jgi:pseudaminic acid cytidylyltransferase
MSNSKVSFAIIPARGGSKRIKNKNVKEFNGKPILYWTVKKLRKSKIFSKIIVSTDDNIIKKIAYEVGADIVINRPKNISGDFAITKDVILHAINLLEKEHQFQFVCCVYPCNPFLEVNDLRKSFDLIKNSNKFSYPVTEYSHPIYRSIKFGKKNNLYFLYKGNENKRTQDFKKTYYDAGQFYWAKKKTWESKNNMHGNAKGVILPSWRVIDLDNVSDWKKAELLFKIFNK